MPGNKKRFYQRAIELAREEKPGLGSRLAEEFGLSRTTASKWLGEMVAEGLLEATGEKRGRIYRLASRWTAAAWRVEGLSEDLVWREFAHPFLRGLPENALDIWHYGITEMVNNVIDHSGSPVLELRLERNPLRTLCWVIDRGEGIFHKIQRALNLYDPRDALIELAKGKFTTDPEHHTGEGIFFCSKVFDRFQIHSSGLLFTHEEGKQDVLLEREEAREVGTRVLMELRNSCRRTLKEVMDQFAAPEEYTFSKTIVPVRLALHEGEKLVSRSQAKRIAYRFERFENVILDFTGVEEIGQAFADELFRVFPQAHPGTRLTAVNTTPAIDAMIRRVSP